MDAILYFEDSIHFFILNLFAFVFLFLNFLYGEESVGCYEATVTPFGFDITKDITTINFNRKQ